jgi:hypothetical protein
MRRDVLRRVRWGNVALAAAVLAALVIVVVWPLVTDSTPMLPPDAARPLVVPEAPAGAEANPPKKHRKARTERPPKRAAGRPGAKRRPRAGAAPRSARPRRTSERPRPATSDPAMERSREQSRSAPAGALAPPARTVGSGRPRRAGAGGEFGFEGGG